MNKCTTNQYMIFLIHSHVPSYDPKSTITISFNIYNAFNERSHDHWNLWNVWYFQIRFWFWSRRRSLWAGVSAKTCTFTLWNLTLGLWLLTIGIFRINSLAPRGESTRGCRFCFQDFENQRIICVFCICVPWQLCSSQNFLVSQLIDFSTFCQFHPNMMPNLLHYSSNIFSSVH